VILRWRAGGKEISHEFHEWHELVKFPGNPAATTGGSDSGET